MHSDLNTRTKLSLTEKRVAMTCIAKGQRFPLHLYIQLYTC